VRIAVEEVLRGRPLVVGVLERVDLVHHLIVMRANFRLPTWTT
jgi:hypothetical protein